MFEIGEVDITRRSKLLVLTSVHAGEAKYLCCELAIIHETHEKLCVLPISHGESGDLVVRGLLIAVVLLSLLFYSSLSCILLR